MEPGPKHNHPEHHQQAVRLRRLRRWATLTVCLVGLTAAIFASPLYRAYVNARFITLMDDTHGEDNWQKTYWGADHQEGQEIQLYRTLYVALLYPKFRRYTPWATMSFTHKTTCAYQPWHYYIGIRSGEKQHCFYWSMKENRWVSTWE